MNLMDDMERKLELLLRNPENAQRFNEVGVILYRVKDWKNSALYFQKAYELNPTDKDILYNYAFLLAQQSHCRKAVLLYQQYLELYPEGMEVMEKLGDLYYRLGEYESAENIYRKLRKLQKGGAMGL